jgi:DNA polymerase V
MCMTPDFFKPEASTTAKLPLFESKVPAGFPSPCEPHIKKRLNAHEYLVDQEDATYFVSVCGLSLVDMGIIPGDIAVVNKALANEAKMGSVILAVIDGEFTLKILAMGEAGYPLLQVANADMQAIQIKEGTDFQIWGVVTGIFRRLVP